MTRNNLKDALRSIVHEHGFERVHDQLHAMQISESHTGQLGLSAQLTAKGRKARKAARKPRLTAPQYVAKMELPLEKEPSVAELAERFHAKAFLPSFGDIANFCHLYSIDVPASRTRANAIPRVFKFIAEMESHDIQKIVDEGMFSGPSRLGPIADAIRRNGRASSAAATSSGNI